MRAFKYRIYPTKKQLLFLEQTLTTCRYLHNSALEERINTYKQTKKTVHYTEQANNLSQNKDEFQEQIHSQVLQQALKRVQLAYDCFFDYHKKLKAYRSGKTHTKPRKVGRPRFKQKNRYRSFCYPQSGFKLNKDCTRIDLSKIGSVKIIYSRPHAGTIKTCRVLKEVDQWFVILTCELPEPTEPVRIDLNQPSGAIDLGLIHYVAVSDKTTEENPKFLRKSEKRLKRLQRRLSRKPRDPVLKKLKSEYKKPEVQRDLTLIKKLEEELAHKPVEKNREKARIQVAKQHRKIARQRLNFLFWLSCQMLKKFKIIFVEDLSILNMLKNHKLAKSISDAAWGKFLGIVTYQAESAGGCALPVNCRGSSQTCVCGEPVPKKLKDRVHKCPKCGYTEDRDIVSAEVLHQRGLKLLEKIKSSVGTTPTLQELKKFLENAYRDSTSTPETHVLEQAGSLK